MEFPIAPAHGCQRALATVVEKCVVVFIAADQGRPFTRADSIDGRSGTDAFRDLLSIRESARALRFALQQGTDITPVDNAVLGNWKSARRWPA